MNYIYEVIIVFVFIADIHKVRPHKGQGIVARRLRSLLHSDTHPSEIAGMK